MKINHYIALFIGVLALPAYAAEQVEMIQNIQEIRISLDSVWVIMGGILVFFMQAGFAMIESGSVRSKNTVNVLMKNYMDACLGGLVFWIVGFGLMFGVNQSGWLGTSHFLPNQLDDWHWNLLFFQMMFAATATTIASGAMAERIRFVAYVVSAAVVNGLIYPVFGSWAWGAYLQERVGSKPWALLILPALRWCIRLEDGSRLQALSCSAHELDVLGVMVKCIICLGITCP